MQAKYSVQRIQPEQSSRFPDSGIWSPADAGVVGHFHPKSGEHRPEVRFRLVMDDQALYLRFDVSDRYVRCTTSQPQSLVCMDSCVEFFVQPASSGYLNFEFAANGTVLCYHITDPARRPDGFAGFRPLTAEELRTLDIRTSIQGIVDPEIADPLSWWLAVRIPVPLLAIAGGGVPAKGSQWRANFYKCADATSHPHWGTWSPLGEELNFHLPRYFGTLVF